MLIVSYHNICRKYPDFSDNKSGMFIVKIVDRRDSLSSHLSSVKHTACLMKYTSKTKHMTGLVYKVMAKMNLKDMRSFSTHLMLCLKKQPAIVCHVLWLHFPMWNSYLNGLRLCSDYLGSDVCITFIKTIWNFTQWCNRPYDASSVYFNYTGSSVTDQEAILLYMSILTLTTPTAFESIESRLKKQDE